MNRALNEIKLAYKFSYQHWSDKYRALTIDGDWKTVGDDLAFTNDKVEDALKSLDRIRA